MSDKYPDLAVHTPDAYAFGPFLLRPAARSLTRDQTPVRLGGRAFDLLVALVAAAGQIVSKKDLIAQVWPDVIVEEGSLRFHMVAVRKALQDGGATGARYVTNVAARGYSFVAPVSTVKHEDSGAGPAALPEVDASSIPWKRALPSTAGPLIGREKAIDDVVAALQRRHIVTVVGSGGIGKSTVALASAHRLAAQFPGDISFVDLSLVPDQTLVAPAVAASLGLTLNTGDPVDGMAAVMRSRKTLLVLDGCEHLTNAVADLIQRVSSPACELRLLATSREALDVEGELVYRLGPLEYPSPDLAVDAQSALQYAAVRLFVERASAGGAGYTLTDADAPLVAKLCRELDGIALAIELAAGRMEAHGLRAMTELIDKRIKLIWHGRRTAVPRHQTMRATLDWSHNLLTEVERKVLRRLAVFVGGFTLDAATAVATHNDLPTIDVVDGVANLTAKSLLNIDAGEETLRYVMLDTTRSYALSRLTDSGELNDVAAAHTRYFKADLGSPAIVRTGTSRKQRAADLGNYRAALDWSLVAQNDVDLGCMLTAALTPALLELALLAECRRWTDLALQSMTPALRGSRCEMDLQAALAQTLMFTGGNSDEASVAYHRALEIARTSKDLAYQLRLLSGVSIFRHRVGDFRGALTTTREAEQVALEMGDAGASAMADSMHGVALHLVGQNVEAQRLWERAIARGVRPNRLSVTAWYGFDHHIRALCGQARLLWLKGYSTEAARVALDTISQAEALRHPPSLCIALIWAGSVFFWRRDWGRALQLVERLATEAASHSLGSYLAVSDGLRGHALTHLGRAEEGTRLLQECLHALELVQYGMLRNVFLCALAEGLAAVGQRAEALRQTAHAVEGIESQGDQVHLPEVLLVHGRLLTGAEGVDAREGERVLRQCIEKSVDQGAQAWELRARNLLSAILFQAGKDDDVRAVWAAWTPRPHADFDKDDAANAANHHERLGLPAPKL